MEIKSHPEYRDHEDVVLATDPHSGLNAIIAIHSTVLGPAAGGCRVWTYDSQTDALADALRLSRGMTYKNAIAGLDLGGGKAVIVLEQGQEKTEEMMLAFGRAVNELGGRYYTAEDVGVSTADMAAVHTQTAYVAGLSDGDFASGNPSPITARGVFEGIKLACQNLSGTSGLNGVRVAVQGVGSVGWELCRMLHQSGAHLIVSDVNPARSVAAADRFGAKVANLDQIHAVECEVYAPCALGGTLNRTSIPAIRAQIVAGAANNQLEREEDADLLHDTGVVYLPDFLINAGGILNVAAEINRIDDSDWVDTQIDRLVKRMRSVLEASAKQRRSPHYIAVEMAEQRIANAREAPAGIKSVVS